METIACSVMLSQKSVVILPKIAQLLNGYWPELPNPLPIEIDPQGKQVITLPTGYVTIEYCDSAVPDLDLDNNDSIFCFNNRAEAHVRRHRDHIQILLRTTDQPVDAAILLTKIAAVVLEAQSESIGVVWISSKVLSEKRAFIDDARKLRFGERPVQNWINLTTKDDSQGTSCGYTTGMRELGFMEIEVRRAPTDIVGVSDLIWDIARRMVNGQVVFANGETIQKAPYGRIRIVHASSMRQNGEPVLQLECS